MAFASCQKAEKTAIEFGELPSQAQTFVQTHFADKQIAAVYRDNDISDKDFEVIFTDGANIDFNKRGDWDEVEDRDADGVPEDIIPAPIRQFVSDRHPGQYVVQIGKEGNKYDVELNTDIEIVFDKNGNFVRYDD